MLLLNKKHIFYYKKLRNLLLLTSPPFTQILLWCSQPARLLFHLLLLLHLPLPSFFFFRIIAIMDSRVTPWFKRKRVSQVKTDYAFQHSTHTVQQRTERYQAESAAASLQLLLLWPLSLPRLLQSCFIVCSWLICCCCILSRAVCKILEEIVSCTQSASWHLE